MAEGIGTGLLSRGYAGSNPAGDATKMSLVMRLASQRHCLWRETGSIPVRGADDSSRVMRLVPQRYCLWRETGSIPVRGTHGVQSHGDQGASKTPREGSIPSRPAVRESFFSSVLKRGRSEVSFCTCNAGLGVRLPAAPPCHESIRKGR